MRLIPQGRGPSRLRQGAPSRWLLTESPSLSSPEAVVPSCLVTDVLGFRCEITLLCCCESLQNEHVNSKGEGNEIKEGSLLHSAFGPPLAH